MGIKANFTRSDFQKALREKLKQMDNAIVNRMMFVGETFVKNARANGTYKDQTGNLRSSICYIVMKDGKKRSVGSIPSDSKKLIDELKSKYMQGYVLIVVAGMNYAAAVESKGRDVLTGSSILAKSELTAAFKNLTKS